ncbi:MAG: gamma-D-glutamyl-L-lysine dipeptidyl-peptidase [Frankiaceae bacterium]|nr:gamma-D-glutamyl-L-lysine dipeptidyl-peptidase [Frankiaceae bacterium]
MLRAGVVVATLFAALAIAPAPSNASINPYDAWVSVSVATLWTSTSAPRAVDHPAMTAPVDIRGWLADMDTASRRGLVGRVATQALLGEHLTVIGAARGGWLHVIATAQRTSLDSRGYPGWVPVGQTTTHRPTATTYVATVTARTAWLVDNNRARVLEVSFATRLPVTRTGGSYVTVITPAGVSRRIAATGVVVTQARVQALPKTVTGVIATARTLIGIPYLWGGRSGYALDCSGLTQLVYRLHGVTLPRDTGDQAKAGRAVSVSSRSPGDLLFYGGSTMTHVALQSTSTRMIEAPSSGLNVREVVVRTPVLVRRLI